MLNIPNEKECLLHICISILLSRFSCQSIHADILATILSRWFIEGLQIRRNYFVLIVRHSRFMVSPSADSSAAFMLNPSPSEDLFNWLI